MKQKKALLVLPFLISGILLGVFLFGSEAKAIGSVIIAPNTNNTDNLIGAANARWKFTMTSTVDLARGDVLQFWFPNGISMIPQADQFSVTNASVFATSSIGLYTTAGTVKNLSTNPSFESDFATWNTDNFLDVATSSITTTAFSGSKALRLKSAGDTNYVIATQALAVSSSVQYTLSYYARGATGTESSRVLLAQADPGCTGGYNGFYYNFVSSSWACADASDPSFFASTSPYVATNTLTADFQRFNRTFTTTNTTTLTILLMAGGEPTYASQAVLYDAVQLETGGSATSFSIGVGPDTLGVAQGDPKVVYGYVTSTVPSSTQFSVTIGGITNPFGRRSVLQSLTWTVKAGTLAMGMPGYYNSLETTKFDTTATTSVVRAGGSLVVDEYTGVTLNTYATGTAANYTFKLTPTSSIPVGGKIIIEFPSTYAALLGSAAVSTTLPISLGGTTTSTIGGFTTSTSGDGGRRLHLVVSSTAVAANDPLTVTINNITNPATVGVYGADSAGPGNRFMQFTVKSNNGLLDGSIDPYSDGDFGSNMGPPPPSSVIIGGKHTVNILVKMNTATTTRDLTTEERAFLQIGMGNPDKGYFIGARRLGTNSTAQYTGLLDGTYRVGAELMNKSSADSYSTLLSPGERTVSLLSAATTTITTTLYFGQPNATTTFTLTGGVPGQNAFILATSPNYQSFAPVYTDNTYVTQGFSATGTGHIRVKVKTGETWSFNVMGGSSFGGNTNFSSGTTKYWPPAISAAYIAATGTTNLGSYAYTQADKALNVSLKYAGTADYVTNACVGVKRTGGGMFMGEQDMVCSSGSDGGSDANVYEFRVPSGALAVTVSRPGMGQPDEYPVAITSSTNSRTIYLTGVTNYISVTVADSSGNAIRNASVYAKSTTGGFGQGMTGSTGTTTIYVPVGTYTVEGFAPGMGSLGSQNATVADGSNPPIIFTIVTGNLRTVSGRVMVGGTGLSGVKIGARGTGATSGGNGTETDSSGNYTLYLPAGVYEVGGWSPDIGGLTPTTADVTSGNVTGKNWTFAGDFGTVRITINNSSNLSQLFAGVFNPSNGRGSGTDSWTASGTAKFADIRIPAGDYVVNAGSPITGPIIEGQAVTVTAGATANVTGDAQASVALKTISGAVTLSSTGVKDVNVWASRMGSPRFFSVLTDASGNYTLYVPANGTYRVGVKAQSYITVEGDVSVAVTTTNRTGHDFTLTTAGSSITGRVTGDSTSITNGWVSAKKLTAGGTEAYTGAPTDGYGNYTLSVDSGTWTVFAEAPGYGRSTGTSTAAGGTNVNITLTSRSGWTAPTPMVQGITDTSGGQMSMTNSTLNLPANALGTGSSVITVTMASTTPRSAPNATALKNSSISISASNSSGQAITSLNSNATLSITLNSSDLTELKVPESSLQFAYFDETSGQWEPMAATIDTVNHVATVQTDHFTDFSPVVGGPDAPTGLAAATTTPGQINLNWSASIATTTYYVVYATTSVISDFPTSTLLATTTATSYNHTSLTTGAAWYYKVAGVNDVGEGPNSDRANATVAALSAPTGLSATAASVSQINLSWIAVSGAASYKVYHDADSYAVAIGAPSTNSYSDSSLTAATTYSYKVSAVNSNGEGTKTGAVSATTNSNASAAAGGSGSTTSVVPTLGVTPASVTGGNIVAIRLLKLNFSVTNADYVAISENANFTGAAWLTYTPAKDFTLSDGSGVKKVYVKFRSASGGETAVQTLTITANLPGAQAATGDVSTPAFSEVTITNPASAVAVTPPIIALYQPGAALKFSYTYKNETGKTVQVRIARQLLDSKGKVVKSATVNKTLKKGVSFTGKINEALPSSLKPGIYTVRVRILDSKGKVLEENSFKIQMEKLKKKFFILSADTPTDTDIVFDAVVLKKVKSNVTLPATLKIKYSYTNNSGVKHTVKMTRELVDASGKTLETKPGKWTMKVGEKDSTTFTQAIGSKLAAGGYMIRLRAYDWTSKELLAENSVGFVVELK